MYQRLDLSDAVTLLSCVKSKLPHRAPARLLYCSQWFCKARDLVERRNARWLILSALYGLVEPDQAIEPYELTLNSLGVSARHVWADRVLQELLPKLQDSKRVVFFAGTRYREFLVPTLQRQGLTIEVPMEGLTQGRQLAWLGSQP